MKTATIRLSANGVTYERTVPVRLTLLDFLRDELGLTGTHAGCEHGVCGCCNVLLDGRSVRACLLFAVQADGAAITTVEGLAEDGQLHPVQQAFVEHHALQCGYCTPGMLITAYELLNRTTHPSEAAIREALAGNLCRCTGYLQIIEAIEAAGRIMAGEDGRDA